MKKILYSLLLMPTLFASSPKAQYGKATPSSPKAQLLAKAEKEKTKVKFIPVILKITRQPNNKFTATLDAPDPDRADNDPYKSFLAFTEDVSGNISGKVRLTVGNGTYTYIEEKKCAEGFFFLDFFKVAKAVKCPQMKDSDNIKEFQLAPFEVHRQTDFTSIF